MYQSDRTLQDIEDDEKWTRELELGENGIKDVLILENEELKIQLFEAKEKLRKVLSLKSLQTKVGSIEPHSFQDRTCKEFFILNTVSNLLHEIGNLAKGSTTENAFFVEVQDAIGTLVIYLVRICNEYNLSMELCIKDVLEELKFQDWNKFPINGITK